MSRPVSLAPAAGLAVGLLLVSAAMVVPAATGWHVHVNHVPPLHADWAPRVGPGTAPAVVLAVVSSAYAVPLAARLRWRSLLLASYAAGLAWMLSLALVDGRAGIGTILDTRYEYLSTARTIHFSTALHGWIARIPYDGLPDDIPDHNWPVHVAGHPPGATGFFVVLVKLGLGSGLAAGLVVTALAASTALAVMVTLRVLGAEVVARRAAPFLVLGPAAVWQCVSADAMFAAVAAWGTAVLAVAAVRRSIGWALAAGVLLGGTVMLSYGLPVMALLALAVLVVARSWKPLPWTALAALAVVAAFGAFGFWWWQALPALHERYWEGVASRRPPAYWLWGDLAALTFSAGPLVWSGLAVLRRGARDVDADPARVARWLAGAGVSMVLVADASLMSMAEVERIWLPFVPWLLVGCGLLPERWRRGGLVLQLGVALAVQHLFRTGW
jgi:hypothetical protein